MTVPLQPGAAGNQVATNAQPDPAPPACHVDNLNVPSLRRYLFKPKCRIILPEAGWVLTANALRSPESAEERSLPRTAPGKSSRCAGVKCPSQPSRLAPAGFVGRPYAPVG